MSDSPYAYVFRGDVPEGVVEPGKTGLVIIDMQYLDAHPEFGIGRDLAEQGKAHLAAGFFERLRTTVVPNIQELLRACRAAGVDVIFVKIECQKPDLSDAGRQYRLWGITSPRGSKEAEILEELAPQPGEIVIAKTGTSAFNSTNIDQVLHNLGIEVLIMTGVNTSGCVELNTRDAADRGYWVLLVEDACAAFGGEEAHRSAIGRLNKGLVKVKTTAEIVAKFGALARRSE